MQSHLFEKQIQSAVSAGKITWQKHALQRMYERDIYRSDIVSVLVSGELIEYYEDDNPLPSGLFLGYVNKKHCMLLQLQTARLAVVISLQLINRMPGILNQTIKQENNEKPTYLPDVCGNA